MAIRVDDTGFSGLKLIQDSESFCYGVDAVLLAHYSFASPNEKALDLGSGNGAVSLVLIGKYGIGSVTGIEIQEPMCSLARESARLNGLTDRLSFINGDVLNIKDLVDPETFDLCTCNPPYQEAGRGMPPSARSALLARFETSASFEDFAKAAAYALKPGGRFVVVHRPSRLVDIFRVCRERGLEPKRMQMVVPFSGAPANIVLLSCTKGGGRELIADSELAIRKGGAYSPELERIYGRA